jgi:hypothetical protein
MLPLPYRTAPFAVLAALLAWPEPMQAQEARWRISLSPRAEIVGEIDRQKSESSGGPDREFNQERVEERIGLDLEGHLLRPDLMRFRMAGDVGLRHTWLDSAEEDLGRNRGRVIEYDGSLDLLSDMPISMSLFGTRFEDRAVRDFGTDNEVTGESRGITLRFRNRHFPATLSQRRIRSISETVEPKGSRRDEEREILEFTGTHKSDATRFRLALRDEDVNDRSFPPVGDYRIREASAVAGTHWGAYFEHSFDTSGRITRRTGNQDRDTISASSAYRWDVTEDLSSDLSYRFNRFDASGFVTTAQSASYQLQHQFYESIHSRFRLNADRVSQDNGLRTNYGGGLGISYRKRFFWDSTIRATLGVDRQITENDLESAEVSVFGEQLSVAGFAGNFLRESRIEVATISVTDQAGTPLIEGIDYEVIRIGDQTSIDVLPSGNVQIGQTLLVDYDYQTSPQFRSRTDRLRYGLGWELGWLALQYQHGQSEEELLEGIEEGPLADSRLDSYRVTLRRRSGAVRATAEASFTRARSQTLDRDEWMLSQSLIWTITRRLALNADLREGFSDFGKPDRSTTNLLGSVALVWRPARRYQVRGFVRYWSLDDSLSEDQQQLTVGGRAQLTFGNIKVTPSLEWSNRERGSSRVTDLRGVLRLAWSL